MNNRFIYLGVILVAVILGSAGVWYNQSSAELTDAEVISVIEAYFRSDEGQRLIEKEVLSDSMDFEEVQKAIQLLDTQHEIKFKAVEGGFIAVREHIQSLELEIALLKAGIVGTGSSSGNNGDFDLEICHDFRCDNDSSRFNQGEAMYLIGRHNTNDKVMDWDIFNSDNVRIDDGQSTITSGNFLWAWDIPDDLNDDTYKLIIEIDNDEDEVNFIVD